MRLWEGIEREGSAKGVKTLFVESKCVNQADLLMIRREAKKRNISRIYFGAGKISPQYINEEWCNILNGFKVVVETTLSTFYLLSCANSFSSIILRTDLTAKNYENIVPKIDNGEKVTLYYNGITNSVKTVKNGIYTDTDKIIKL